MGCYYGFPYGIVIEGGNSSYIQMSGYSVDRMARRVANVDGTNVIYPTYYSLIDQGNGLSTLP